MICIKCKQTTNGIDAYGLCNECFQTDPEISCQDCGKRFITRNVNRFYCGCRPSHCLICSKQTEDTTQLCNACHKEKNRICIICEDNCPFKRYCVKHASYGIEGDKWLLYFNHLVDIDESVERKRKRIVNYDGSHLTLTRLSFCVPCDICNNSYTALYTKENPFQNTIIRLCSACDDDRTIIHRTLKVFK